MEIWTPSDRNAFINTAITTANSKGNRGAYHYNVYPKTDEATSVNEDLDAKRSSITEAFARTIYMKNPKYKYMSLGFYYSLVEKIRTNINIGHYLWTEITVVIKGANAYAYLTKDSTMFPYSDLDIMIYINPFLTPITFNTIKKELRMIVHQLTSQYKRLLDNMFFVTGSNKYKDSDIYKEARLFDEETIEQFKKDFNDELAKINLSTPGRIIISPFEDDRIRNSCSRYSFLLTKSESQDNSIVRIDIPHYDKCENIPLKKSPFYVSSNETIDFKRDEAQTITGQFDLHRIRFNNLFIEIDEDGNSKREEKICADFIDVSIACQTDAELIDFWQSSRCEYVMDPDANAWKVHRDNKWEVVNCWMIMPNIATCINDLYKMLNVYESAEGKKLKREARYKALKKVAGLI